MQAADWTGTIGDSWAALWPQTDRTFAPLDAALVDRVAARLAITSAPHVLDIGCGAGTTALAIAARVPGAKVTGIDLSPALIAVATGRGVAVTRAGFVVADAARWNGEDGFDLLVSRHGVMFFADPVAAFIHLHGLARPGASLIFSCFRAATLNPWASGAISLLPAPPAPSGPGAPGPFAFADKDRVAALLDAAGWREAAAEPIDYAYVAAEGDDDPVAAATAFFLRIGPLASAVRALDAAARTPFLDRFARFLDDHRDGGRIVFPAAAWLWSARA